MQSRLIDAVQAMLTGISVHNDRATAHHVPIQGPVVDELRAAYHAAKKADTRDYSAIVALADWPTEDDENYAMRVLRARYERGVTERAEEYVKLLRAGEFDDASDLDDRVHEDIDGDSDVIYTAQAATVGFVSRFDWQEQWDETGGDKAPTTEQIAFLCLKGDVLAEIENLLGEDVDSFLTSLEDEDASSDDADEEADAP